MSDVAEVKPIMFTLDHEDGSTERIPYVAGFEYDNDESIIFSARAGLIITNLFVEMTGCMIEFRLEDLLANALAWVDHPDFAGDLDGINDMLSVLESTVAELRKRREALNKPKLLEG